MSDNSPQQKLSLVEGLQPFRGRDRWHHVLVVVGGILVWVVTYVLVMNVTGWDTLASADSLKAVHARRNAAGIAGTLAGLYFAILWTRAYGGPILNVLYLIGIVAFMPARVYSLGGAPPTNVISSAGSYYGLDLLNPTWVWDHAVAAMPGGIVLILVLIYWMKTVSPEREQAFGENHLPEAWLRLRRPK